MSAEAQVAADVKTGKIASFFGSANNRPSPPVAEDKSSTSSGAGGSTPLQSDNVLLQDPEIRHQLNHRRLTPRMIQLLALAGTVDATLFVVIGSPLQAGGPGNLFIGMCIWVSAVYFVALCQAEMVSYLPFDGAYIRNAGLYVDDAYGVATGFNYAVLQAALICFEINIFSEVVGYWQTIHPAIIPSVLIPVFFAVNIWSVAIFGEAEFWFAFGKLLLIIGCLFYTFVVMVGGNPSGDAFGFRYWNDPGSFREFRSSGALGRFEGFLQCLIGVAFIVAGPEYISILAGEAVDPRRTMPKAFTSIIYRLIAFFCLGALAVGICVPYTEPGLGGPTTASSSPYVLSMENLNIPILPDIVNATILTSIFSSGNAYVYGTSRSLYSLALAGHLPKFLTLVNRNGVPWVCVIITMLIACLSYLQVSAGGSTVLVWWTNLVTAGQVMNWLIMATTYLFFRRALKAQKKDPKELPYTSKLLPWGAYWTLFWATLVMGTSGYVTLTPGNFAVDDFLFAYGMCFFDAAVYIFYKVYKRTKFIKPEDVDFSAAETFDLCDIEWQARREKRANKKKHIGEKISDVLFD